MKNKIKVSTYIDKDFKTKATRNSRTGQFTGRVRVQGLGDKTAVRRVRYPKKDAGEIWGRTKRLK